VQSSKGLITFDGKSILRT